MRATFNPFSNNFDFIDLPAGGKFLKNGNTLELWWNGSIVQSWTVTPVAPITLGSPYGLLLTLTQPA